MLSVKGVDMVQFGPADYSMSIGIPGQWDHPTVKEAEVQVIKTALRLGVAPRVEIDTPEHRVGLELTARSLGAKRTPRAVRRSWLGRFLGCWRWPR